MVAGFVPRLSTAIEHWSSKGRAEPLEQWKFCCASGILFAHEGI